MKMPMKLMKANSTKARKTIRKQNRMYLEFCGYVIMVGFTDTAMNGHKKGAKMMFLDGILLISIQDLHSFVNITLVVS